MSDEVYAEILQILCGQLRQYRGIDLVVVKRLLVLPQPEIPEPRRYVHFRLPVGVAASRKLAQPVHKICVNGDDGPASKASLCVRRKRRSEDRCGLPTRRR
jgi:hypothetical protein